MLPMPPSGMSCTFILASCSSNSSWRPLRNIILWITASSSSRRSRNGPSLRSDNTSDIHQFLADRVSVISQLDPAYPHVPDRRCITRRRKRQWQMRMEIGTDHLHYFVAVQTEPIGVTESMMGLVRVPPEDDLLPAPHPVCLRMNPFMRSITLRA